MIRTASYAALAALFVVAIPSVHAEVIHMNVTTYNPYYAASFGGLSFNLNTAATTDTIGTGSCGNGQASGVYTSFSAAGGISDATLNWNGVDYSLQSSNFYLDSQGGCVFDLGMNLTFNNNTSFIVEDDPTGGPYSYSEYNPSQMLSSAVLKSYNGDILHSFLTVEGQEVARASFQVTATPVPEPDTIALFAAGLAGIVLTRRRVKA